jgi:hypothetical protein
MPKKPADKIIEHRISMSNSVKALVEKQQKYALIQNSTKPVIAGGVLVAGVGFGYLAYSIVKYLGVGNAWDDAKSKFADWAVPFGDDVIETINNIAGTNIKTGEATQEGVARQMQLFKKQLDEMEKKYLNQMAIYEARLSTPNLSPTIQATIRADMTKLTQQYEEAVARINSKIAIYSQNVNKLS